MRPSITAYSASNVAVKFKTGEGSGLKAEVKQGFKDAAHGVAEGAAQVALEAGNSPQMIFRHYRELVRPADAEKWFAVTAESVGAAKAAREGDKEEKIVKLPVVEAA